MHPRKVLIPALLPFLALALICPSANAQTADPNQMLTTVQSVEEQFIGQLLAAELQTVFQQADSYVASSLLSKLGGVAATQPTAQGDDFFQQLSLAILQTFFQQLDSLIAQLPALLMNSQDLFGTATQSSAGQ
jgi:hypothetical protein